MKIPFMDLPAQIKSLEKPLRERMDQILSTANFIGGPSLEGFNKNFLNLHGGKYGMGCANGTSAITVALRALGIGPGDEVLIPNHTFIATAEAVVEVGATPVLLEIEPEFHQIDLRKAEERVTPRTKAL